MSQPVLSKCPQCGQTVPDWSPSCQFCGTALAGRTVARRGDSHVPSISGRPKWIEPAYIAVSIWWIVTGLRGLLAGLKLLPQALGGTATALAGVSFVAIVIGSIIMLLGIGLLLKVEIARGIVNILSWLQILGALFGLATAVLGSLILGWVGLLMVVLNLVDIATAGGTVYLIGETDSGKGI